MSTTTYAYDVRSTHIEKELITLEQKLNDFYVIQPTSSNHENFKEAIEENIETLDYLQGIASLQPKFSNLMDDVIHTAISLSNHTEDVRHTFSSIKTHTEYSEKVDNCWSYLIELSNAIQWHIHHSFHYHKFHHDAAAIKMGLAQFSDTLTQCQKEKHRSALDQLTTDLKELKSKMMYYESETGRIVEDSYKVAPLHLRKMLKPRAQTSAILLTTLCLDDGTWLNRGDFVMVAASSLTAAQLRNEWEVTVQLTNGRTKVVRMPSTCLWLTGLDGEVGENVASYLNNGETVVNNKAIGIELEKNLKHLENEAINGYRMVLINHVKKFTSPYKEMDNVYVDNKRILQNLTKLVTEFKSDASSKQVFDICKVEEDLETLQGKLDEDQKADGPFISAERVDELEKLLQLWVDLKKNREIMNQNINSARSQGQSYEDLIKMNPASIMESDSLLKEEMKGPLRCLTNMHTPLESSRLHRELSTLSRQFSQRQSPKGSLKKQYLGEAEHVEPCPCRYCGLKVSTPTGESIVYTHEVINQSHKKTYVNEQDRPNTIKLKPIYTQRSGLPISSSYDNPYQSNMEYADSDDDRNYKESTEYQQQYISSKESEKFKTLPYRTGKKFDSSSTKIKSRPSSTSGASLSDVATSGIESNPETHLSYTQETNKKFKGFCPTFKKGHKKSKKNQQTTPTSQTEVQMKRNESVQSMTQKYSVQSFNEANLDKAKIIKPGSKPKKEISSSTPNMTNILQKSKTEKVSKTKEVVQDIVVKEDKKVYKVSNQPLSETNQSVKTSQDYKKPDLEDSTEKKPSISDSISAYAPLIKPQDDDYFDCYSQTLGQTKELRNMRVQAGYPSVNRKVMEVSMQSGQINKNVSTLTEEPYNVMVNHSSEYLKNFEAIKDDRKGSVSAESRRAVDTADMSLQTWLEMKSMNTQVYQKKKERSFTSTAFQVGTLTTDAYNEVQTDLVEKKTARSGKKLQVGEPWWTVKDEEKENKEQKPRDSSEDVLLQTDFSLDPNDPRPLTVEKFGEINVRTSPLNQSHNLVVPNQMAHSVSTVPVYEGLSDGSYSQPKLGESYDEKSLTMLKSAENAVTFDSGLATLTYGDAKKFTNALIQTSQDISNLELVYLRTMQTQKGTSGTESMCESADEENNYLRSISKSKRRAKRTHRCHSMHDIYVNIRVKCHCNKADCIDCEEAEDYSDRSQEDCYDRVHVNVGDSQMRTFRKCKRQRSKSLESFRGLTRLQRHASNIYSDESINDQIKRLVDYYGINNVEKRIHKYHETLKKD